MLVLNFIPKKNLRRMTVILNLLMLYWNIVLIYVSKRGAEKK
jgi:preprotein translocase subunit SecG